MQVSVNMKAARRLWEEFKRDNMLQMCRGMILHQLMKNGISLEKNKNEYEPSYEIQDTMDMYWHAFVQDALDSAMCLGFVVVAIIEDEAKRRYPTVVYPHLFQLKYTVRNNIYEYFLSSSFVDIETTHIYTDFGCHPLPNGEITSVVSRVMEKTIFLRTLRHTTLLMEKHKTNPDYFAEVHDKGNRERTEGIDFDFYADMQDNNAQDDLRFERNKKNVDILIQQQELYQTLQGNESRQVKNLRNITQLPEGQKVVATSQNTGRQDVAQIHKIMQEEICSGMGVPRSLMIGDSLYKSDTDGVTDMFKHTILWWKESLGSMCTDIYQKLYVDTKNIKIRKNVYLAKLRHQIKVKFPVNPYVPIDQLDYLYSKGIIDWDTYSKHCLQAASLPASLRQEEPPLQEVNVADVVPGDAKRKRSAR